MSPGQMKLRSDLRVSQQETPGGVSFVVKNPATGRFFRFYGLLAWVYSIWILVVVALHFGSFLVERYQGARFSALACCWSSP
jgi:hypothetical protein